MDYVEEFRKPKISFLVFQVKPSFAFDTNGTYSNNAVWSFPSTDKYLLAFLNSKLGWFLISQYCTQIQGGYQLIWKNFSRVPVKAAKDLPGFDKGTMSRLEKLVDLAIKERKTVSPGVHGQTQVEREIDDTLFALYGLSKAEIAILEQHWGQNTKSKGANREEAEAEDELSMVA